MRRDVGKLELAKVWSDWVIQIHSKVVEFSAPLWENILLSRRRYNQLEVHMFQRAGSSNMIFSIKVPSNNLQFDGLKTKLCPWNKSRLSCWNSGLGLGRFCFQICWSNEGTYLLLTFDICLDPLKPSFWMAFSAFRRSAGLWAYRWNSYLYHYNVTGFFAFLHRGSHV